MDEANRIVHQVLNLAEKNLIAGITTEELDAILEVELLATGAQPAFKDYKGYKHTTCISVNEQVVHGVPSKRIIQEGDVVSVDVGCKYRGFFGDAARTLIVGKVDWQIENLIKNTRQAVEGLINVLKEGNRLYDVNKYIEIVATLNKYGIVKGFTGHGVGKNLHENPSIFNYVEIKEPNVRLRNGMVFAIEPMFVLGKPEVEILEDGWTVATKDKSIAAHWEYSIAITPDGPKVLGI
jgi:methionyl aminopeptidase